MSLDVKCLGKKEFPKEYVFDMCPARRHGLVSSLSDNSLRVVPFDPELFNKSAVVDYKNAHDGVITGLKTIDLHSVATSSADGTIKMWDFRINNKQSSQIYKNDNSTPLTCLDVHQGKLAAGTELVGVDSGVMLWDMRVPNKPIVSYMDAHNEDVTQVQFHPDEANGLLSAAQDGYVHIYNTTITDMDEAIYQTINHNNTPIQRAGFLKNRKVFAKSNMETMAIYHIPDPDSEEQEPKPHDFGDLRMKWNCEYVADILNGFVAVGSNNENQEFRVMAWDNETDSISKTMNLIGAHGEEVVRSVYLDAVTQCIYTGGEDGCVKVWKPEEALDVDNGEWEQVKKKKKKNSKKDKSEKKRYKPY